LDELRTAELPDFTDLDTRWIDDILSIIHQENREREEDGGEYGGSDDDFIDQVEVF
jgi:hypothetical protein